jgi:peptidoglycan/xylan/chitin deacetylase (PgdA/CDA1 family)
MMRYLLRDGVLTVAKYLGISRAIGSSRWRGDRVLILCYHGVSIDDEHLWNGELYVTQEHLRSRFEMIRGGGYTVLPLKDALWRLRSDTLPPKSVVLTFDDGAHDFAVRAFPLLEEFQFPATVYLTTHYALNQMPVFNTMLSYLLWKARGESFTLPVLEGGAAVRIPHGSLGRLKLWSDIQEQVVAQMNSFEKDRTLDEIAGQTGIDLNQIRARKLLHLMTPEDVKNLDPDLVDVQLHTHRHRSPDERDDFLAEIIDNQRALADAFGGRDLTHFCYPSGFYREEHVQWLRESGADSATTCDPGLASPRTDHLLLPRFIDTLHTSEITFSSWLSGLTPLLHRSWYSNGAEAEGGLRASAAKVLTSRAAAQVARILKVGKGTIFMLHRFDDVRTPPEFRPVVSTDLRWALFVLRSRGFDLISLTEMINRLEGNSPDLYKSVCFTVDDGYADFYMVGAPLFREFDCPVTIFPTTAFLDGTLWLWWDQLHFVFMGSGRRSIEINVGKTTFSARWQDAASRERALANLVEFLKTIPDPSRGETIAEIAEIMGVAIPETPPIGYEPLSWDQVRELSGQEVTFGPHSVSHPILSQLGAEASYREISKSWDRLCSETDGVVPVFAYPNGNPGDFTEREKDTVKGLGLRAALSAIYGFADARELMDGTNRYEIPRFGFPHTRLAVAQIVTGIERLRPPGGGF